MHRTTLSGTQHRTSAGCGGLRWTRTLKNWLARLRTTRHRTRRGSWWRHGSFVYRTRSGLRHDHSRRRNRNNRLGSGSLQRRRLRRSWRRCGRSLHDWSSGARRNCNCRRRRDRNRRRSYRRPWCDDRGRWPRSRYRSWCYKPGRSSLCGRLRRRRRFALRRCYWRFRLNRHGSWRLGCRTSRGMGRGFRLLQDRFQHISRTGDVRQIDLRLDLVISAGRAG